MKYVFDSNILIAISLGDEKVLSFLNNKKDDEFFVSVITITEVLWHKNMTKSEEEYLEKALAVCEVVSIDEKLAREALLFRRNTKLKTADSLIVATANSINGMLLTRDKDIFISTPEIVIQL